MTGALLAQVVLGLLATGWAGLLALAEESPTVSRALSGDSAMEAAAPRDYLTLYVARLALLVGAGILASSATEWWSRDLLRALGSIGATTGLIYMIAEALPRSVGALAPETASAAAKIAVRSIALLQPFLGAAHWAEVRFRRAIPARPLGGDGTGSAHRDLLLGLFSLGDTTVSEIMTPRLDIDALDASVDWHAAVEKIRHTEHARIPVYTDTIDRIEGILYAKDLVAASTGQIEKPERWQDLIRPALYVPESKTLAAQLRDFQRGPAHLAVVVDEFGGTSGLVTLEDALEEIVGELHDEYDPEEQPAVTREGADKFWVDGAVTLDELEALLGVTFEREDVATVGGFVYDELGRVPRPGERFQFGEFRVVVEQVVRRRVRRVYFERSTSPEATEASP